MTLGPGDLVRIKRSATSRSVSMRTWIVLDFKHDSYLCFSGTFNKSTHIWRFSENEIDRRYLKRETTVRTRR